MQPFLTRTFAAFKERLTNLQTWALINAHANVDLQISLPFSHLEGRQSVAVFGIPFSSCVTSFIYAPKAESH